MSVEGYVLHFQIVKQDSAGNGRGRLPSGASRAGKVKLLRVGVVARQPGADLPVRVVKRS